MDPKIALDEMIVALRKGNWKAACKNAATFQEWLDSGGFVPALSGSQMSKILEVVVHHCMRKEED